MASDLDFIEYACDQLGGAGRIRATYADLPEPKPKKPKVAKTKR